MSRITHLRPQFVEYMPEHLEDGVLYVSERFRIALHNCCCGCGEEVSTPLTATEWRVTVEDNTVSLHPSIGNHDFPCKSHYWIKRNEVHWSGAMSRRQIEAGRAYDRYLKRGQGSRGPGIASEPLRSFFGWLRSVFNKLFR